MTIPIKNLLSRQQKEAALQATPVGKAFLIELASYQYDHPGSNVPPEVCQQLWIDAYRHPYPNCRPQVFQVKAFGNEVIDRTVLTQPEEFEDLITPETESPWTLVL